MSKIKSNKAPIHVRIIRHLREWHRRLGILAAFFLIFLSVTGIALNHTDLLKLAHKSITNDWLLNQYNINPPKDIRFYHQNQLVVTNNFVWFNKHLLTEATNTIVSMGKFKQFFLIATTHDLYLYNEVGKLVDKIDSTAGLPKSITALGIDEDNIFINTVNGYYQTDSNFLIWKSITPIKEPSWFEPSQAEKKDIVLASTWYRSKFLTWERIIVDAHSGRIFGIFGVIFMDITAILLILLSLSGIYIWVRYARSKR